jgi:ATP-dependent DNA ligase
MLPLIDPILPMLSKTVPRGREWLYEAKLDGFRGTLYVEKGIVAKRGADPYTSEARWVKVKHAEYSQKEGRGDLFSRAPKMRSISVVRYVHFVD